MRLETATNVSFKDVGFFLHIAGKFPVIVRSTTERMTAPATMEGQVNAHSSIEKDRKNAVSRRLRSRAFRTGLREGFGAPVLFYLPREYSRTVAIDASVAGAWKAVGDALRSATNEGAKALGETTGKAKLTCD